jgi:hypothetical protein
MVTLKRVVLVLLSLFLMSALLNQYFSKTVSTDAVISISERLFALKSTDNLRTIKEVIGDELVNDYSPMKSNYVNLGKSHERWFKIDLSGLVLSPQQDYVFEVERNAIVRPAEIYYQSNSSDWQRKPLLNQPEYRNRLLASFHKEPLPQTIYLRLTGNYLRASINLYSQEGFLHNMQKLALYNGLYYGTLLLFILFNLVLYSRLKVKAYFAYSVLLSAIFLLFASGQGWLAFLYPNSAIINILPPTIFGLLMALASAEFAKQYLQIKCFSTKLSGVLSILQLVVFFLLVGKVVLNQYLPQTLYFIAYGVGLLAILAIFISCIVAAVISLKQRNDEARYYLSATIIFFSTAILMALSASNIINVKFSWPLLQAASVVEFLIFSAGLLAIYQRQLDEKANTEIALQVAQLELVKQLEFSNNLKDRIITTVVDPKLYTELAKITKILPNIRYVQSSGNHCLVVYSKDNLSRKIELECSLQKLAESFGDKYFLQVHKSYLINPQHNYALKRRTSADYDLLLLGEAVPVGRKYLSQVKDQLEL